MGKALIINGADFSSNAVAQITVISDDVRALFNGRNVGEKGLYAFQNFINSIGGLNGTLWSKVGRMYVPMLFESGTSAESTFFDVKNNTIHAEIPSAQATTSFANKCLTITTVAERTSEYPIPIGDSVSLSSIFGIVDTNFANVANQILLKTGYTPKWIRSSGNEWIITRGKTITAGDSTLSITSFSDAENNSALLHGFIRSDGSVDSEVSILTGTISANRIPYVKINPSGANISLMIVGYFTSGLTEVEVKTVTSALYQMYLDMI